MSLELLKEFDAKQQGGGGGAVQQPSHATGLQALGNMFPDDRGSSGMPETPPEISPEVTPQAESVSPSVSQYVPLPVVGRLETSEEEPGFWDFGPEPGSGRTTDGSEITTSQIRQAESMGVFESPDDIMAGNEFQQATPMTPEELQRERMFDGVSEQVKTEIEQFEAEFDFMDRLQNRLGVGYTRKVANDYLQALTSAREMKQNLLEKGRRRIDIGGNIAEQLPDAEQYVPGPHDAQLGMHLTEINKRIKHLENEFASAVLASYAPIVGGSDEKARTVPVHPAMRALHEAQKAGDQELVNRLMIEFFPEVSAEAALPSISQGGFQQVMLPGGLGALGKLAFGTKGAAQVGFVVGTGVASRHVDERASFAEYLTDKGIDLLNMKQLGEALDDKELVLGARKFARKRGNAIATLDMLSAFLATQKIVPPGFKSKVMQQLSNTSAQIAQQTTLGAAGEALAQVSAGQEFNGLEIKLEALGELPTAVAEPMVFHIAEKIRGNPNDLRTIEDVLNAYLKNPEVTVAETLVAMQQMAETGMTDTEVIAMLDAVPGVEFNKDTIMNNNHSNDQSSFAWSKGQDLREAMNELMYTDADGNTTSGADILEAGQGTGKVYWSTADKVDGSSDTKSSSSTEKHLANLEVKVVGLRERLNELKSQNASENVISSVENALFEAQDEQAKAKALNEEMKIYRPEMLRVVQAIADRFFSGQDILILEDSEAHFRSSDGGKGAWGSAGTITHDGKKTTILSVGTKEILEMAKSKNPARMANKELSLHAVLAHEMGHALMQQLARNIPPQAEGMLKALHRVWLKEQLQNIDQPIQDLVRTRGNPYKADDLGVEYTGTVRNTSKSFRSYSLSFNEFVADLMARQVGKKDSPLAPILSAHLGRVNKIMQTYFEDQKSHMPRDENYADFLRFLGARNQLQDAQKFAEQFSATEKALPAGQNLEMMSALIMHKELDVPPAIQKQMNQDLDRYNKAIRYFTTLLQLRKENPHIIGLRQYVKAVHEHWVTKSNWNDQAMQTLNEWKKLGKAGDELGRLLLEVTVRSDQLERKLKKKEILALIDEKGIKLGKDPTAFWKAYERVNQNLSTALEELYQIERERLSIEYGDVVTTLAGKLTQLDKLFDQLRDRNYFPLSRFGNYGVNMRATKAILYKGKNYKAGEVVHFELYENKAQRNRGVGTLRRMFPPTIKAEFIAVEEELKPFMGLPTAIFQSLRDNKRLGLTPEQKKVINDMLDKMSPTNGIAKRMLERKGTAGFHRDGARGFGNYMMEMGSHIAKMRHAGQMDEAIDSVRRSARYIGTQGIVNDKRHEIADHLVRHRDYLFRPENEWGGLRALAFHWFLGYNMKSAFVNLTQVPLVAYPYLAARKVLTGGIPGKSDAIAIAALVGAMKDVSSFFRDNKSRYSDGEVTMLDVLLAEGIIDESLATELAGIAHGDLLSKMLPLENDLLDTGRRGINTFAKYSTMAFQAAEKLNRRVVAVAAYRLARSAGMDQDTATSEAREALRTTQFEYARWNRAAFMRGKAGVLFVFMQYLQNVLYFVMRDPGKTRYLLMMMMAAGIQGLPGAEDLLDIFDYGSTKLKKWTGDKGDPRTNSREDLRGFMMQLHLNPELMMHGLSSSSFGLSLPIVSDMTGMQAPALSMEASISSGRVVPGLQALLSPTRLSGAGVQEGTKDVLGAALTIPLNILSWAKDPDPDKMRSFERMAPSFMKGIVRAQRIIRDGGLLDRANNEIIDYDPSNPQHVMELVGMTFGFSPTRLVRAQEARFDKREALQFYGEQRQYLLADFFYAKDQSRLGRDDKAPAIAMKAIRDFNKKVPRGQQIMDPGASYLQHLKRNAFDKQGLGARMFDAPTLREMDKTFPAATAERDGVEVERIK